MCAGSRRGAKKQNWNSHAVKTKAKSPGHEIAPIRSLVFGLGLFPFASATGESPAGLLEALFGAPGAVIALGLELLAVLLVVVDEKLLELLHDCLGQV